MAVTLRLLGIREMRNKFSRLASAVPRFAAIGLNTAAELTMTRSKELTPVDKGPLRANAKVSQHATADNLEATLRYDRNYSIFVHEIPPSRARHPVGQWKFLETAINERMGTYDQEIGDAVKRGLNL